MHRLYCDSNIFRLLKPDHPSFNTELLMTMSLVKDIFCFVYSDAHLDDLKESKYVEKTDEDLNLIGEYCKDNYLSFDYHREKKLKMFLATPINAYAEKNYDAVKAAQTDHFDWRNLFEGFDSVPGIESLKLLLEYQMNTPLNSLVPYLDNVMIDEKYKEIYERVIPNYQSSMTIGDFLNSLMPYGSKLLYDRKEFTELRKYVSAYLNSDDFSFEKWGMDFDLKLKNSAVGKGFLELLDTVLIGNQKEDRYYTFTYAYSLLELYGIVQERDSRNKLKKFTYDSLHRDASHAFFASYCDYLVTDDKGLQVKAYLLYQLFGIKTKVFSSRDFINHNSLWRGNEETYKSFKNSFEYDLINAFQLSDHYDIGTSGNVKEFKAGHYYFSYFNRFQKIDNQGLVYAFYCRREEGRNIFFYREIELLIGKMIKVFGVDNYNKGVYSMLENESLQLWEPIRQWTIANRRYEISISNMSSGNYIVLSITAA